MNNLNFQNALTGSKFRYGNEFIFRDLTPLPLMFKKGEKWLPYFSTAVTYHTKEVMQMTPTLQFGGKSLTVLKLKEVMNSAAVPMIVQVVDKKYLACKGFLAEYKTKTDIDILFMACINSEIKTTHINDVTFYVSRNVYMEKHKRVMPAVRDFMKDHTGDVLMTSSILKYIGSKANIPSFKTIGERNAWEKQFKAHCVKKIVAIYK